MKKPSTDQLKTRDRSEGALANAGRNILSQNGSEQALKSNKTNYIKKNLQKVVYEKNK